MYEPWTDSALERYETMTVDEVNAFLPTVLNPDNMTFTLMVPE